jgi:hypothetical protein
MPWRDSGDDWRRRAHDWCVKWWTSAGFEVFEGPGSSRSEMCNNAAELATTRDPEIEVLVFVDADTWTQPEQVVAAVERARETGRLTHAYTSYAVLGSHKTQLLQRRRGINSAMAVRGVQLKRHHVSGACAVPVALWREIGGFDERFVGWGFEDQAFNLAAGCLGGGIERIDGHAVHWYHRDDPTKSRAVDPTDTRILLMEQYCRAACAIPDGGRVARLAGQGTITIESGCQPDPEAMRAVLAGVGGPLAGAVQPAT